MWALIALLVVFLWWARRRAKKRMIAGLVRPAIWREPAPGRIGRNARNTL